MQHRARAEDHIGPPVVLVVDGDPDYCEYATDLLRRAGYDACHVSTAEEAIAFVRKRHPAAVILDAILPGATGYGVCRELREQHGEHLPIMFVSGTCTEPADRVVGLLMGGDDYLVKPIDPDELTARLSRLIARSSAQVEEPPRPNAFAELTTRESQVLRLLAEGLNQENIARELDITHATVGTHIQRVLGKLDVHSRTQAVALAYRERLVEQR